MGVRLAFIRPFRNRNGVDAVSQGDRWDVAQIAEEQNSAAEELKNYELFLKYLEQDSVPATELEQIQKRVEELRAAQDATP